MGHDISSTASAARQSMSPFDPEFTKILCEPAWQQARIAGRRGEYLRGLARALTTRRLKQPLRGFSPRF